MDNGITLDDVLEGIVGQHYPQGDSLMDDESAANTGKLHYIGLWVAQQLSINRNLGFYLESPYASIKRVAELHERAIMVMLEWFEPQVRKYYEEYLKEGK